VLSPLQAADVRRTGEQVIAAQPWPTGWETWRPDPTWRVPALPEDWQTV